VPDGALYIYANIERFSNDSSEFCRRVLDDIAVAITPGADFGKFNANTHVRFAYTTSLTQLEKGVARLREYLKPCV
jgi:aspartate/methionine/tyrosine aminotransferase